MADSSTKWIINQDTLIAIANAIREKTGKSESIAVPDLAEEILKISTAVELTGDATPEEVLFGKTFYSNDAHNKLTGEILTYNGEIEDVLAALFGGSANNPVLKAYSGETTDLISDATTNIDILKEYNLENAKVIDIASDTVGTILLDVSTLGKVGDKIILIHQDATEDWEILYDGLIPYTKEITITLNNSGPVIYVTSATFKINTYLTEVSPDVNNPTTISIGCGTSLFFSKTENYELPDDVIVHNAKYKWDKSTGTLFIFNAKKDVKVIITGTKSTQ